jgi:arylsulfatase
VSGAWGFEYYLERAGARFLDASGSGLARGERVVSSTRLWRRPNAAGALAPIDEIEVRGSPWLAAMDPGTGAAFYAASHGRRRGPLPWAVGRVAPRRYHVMEVRSGFTFRGNVPPRPAARHLVLISVDTLRADHLGAYGADLRATPSLDALARASVRFSEARAPAPFTLPSIAGLLTGRHPGAIGVGSNRGRLAPDVPTLAARLREHGFATGAVVSNPILVEGAGLAPGFDVYDDSLPDREATRGQPERVARRTTDAALALARRLRGTGDARVFLWVHYQDPHGPYTPPEGLRERFLDSEQRRPGGDRELGVAKDWRGIGGLPLYQYLRPFRRVAFYRAGYAGEVAYVDAEVGRLLDGLRAEGLLGSAAVVFTADHGEGLGERDHWFAHGEFLHEPALRVPLLVTGPGLRPAVRHEPASLLDVVPTALALLGLPPVPGMAGVDLARPVPEREFYFTTGNAASLRRRAVLAGGYKLVRSSDRGQPAVELFRLPDETRDLAAAQPERAADLAQRLDAHVAAASAPPVERSPSPEQEEALRALGYAEE